MPTSVTTTAELVLLERGLLRLEIVPRPFSFTLRRAGRRLLRAAGVWVADGTVNDHFVQFTEGVVAHEDLAPVERAVRADVVRRGPDGVELELMLAGRRRARLWLALVSDARVSLRFEAEGAPLRVALEWDRRSEERFVGLGARHCTQFDQGGRTVQLGADRRYTGPDCPPDMLAAGGIPQGDCAPAPWMLSSRGYGVWVRTYANGTRFDLAGERVSVSTRAAAGPLQVELVCDGTPAACLRTYCRLTGFPALLACSGFSNWSHDVGGYLGHRLVERCPPELLARWLQFGCFTPLMQAHARMPQEPWHYSEQVVELYRGYALLHEMLVPYVRAAAATASRCGLPVLRPLCLIDPSDPRGWTITDAYGYGPSLWVAPVLDDGAREREVALPRGEWIETWSGRSVRGGGGSEVVVQAPLERIPVWVRAGSIVVTYPASHVARGLGDVEESSRPLVATLWGAPRIGRAAVRLADGTRIAWRRGEWSVSAPRAREVSFQTVGV